jgi:hypothetical protein
LACNIGLTPYTLPKSIPGIGQILKTIKAEKQEEGKRANYPEQVISHIGKEGRKTVT